MDRSAARTRQSARATTMFPIPANEKLSISPGRTRNHRSRQATAGVPTTCLSKPSHRAEYFRARTDAERDAFLAFPLLDKEPGKVGRRLATLPGAGHPVWTYLCGVLIAFALIASVSIAVGLLVTTALLHVHGVAGEDESLARYLAHHRSSELTDASLVGSIIAGGVVLPIIAGVAALVALVAKHWRLAGFLLFALAVESGSYRATTLVVHRHRPEVHRLEKLPVDASYPSGHTAASIAVYCGHRPARDVADHEPPGTGSRSGLVAALIPVFVAFSRMYRGMHHPLDVAGGALLGIAALSALVLVSRAARSAAR